MATSCNMRFHDLILRPEPGRTVVRPFSPADPDGYQVAGGTRIERVARRILSLDDAQMADECRRMTVSLDQRHRDVEGLLCRRFDELDLGTIERGTIDRRRAMLIAAYFSEEYSFEAAALFNPSIVAHPDQGGAGEGATRFLLSLRGIGEGHVSSVTFRTGTWAADGGVTVDDACPTGVAPRIDKQEDGGGGEPIIRLRSPEVRDISELVLFPMTPGQKQGIEDLRLTRFRDDDGSERYVGTFTAFSGAEVRSELLQTEDFRTFEIRPITGSVAASKGMALFPRRIGGRFAMLGRQDSENIWLLYSDDLARWDGGTRIIRPKWPWEYIQMGNCGSPIELAEGWLVMTHGVGTVRNYCMGACLLDKDDPSKLLARVEAPIIEPNEKDRDGYVPNVVYSCGALLRGRDLLIPYGVADNFATFASVAVDDLLKAMA